MKRASMNCWLLAALCAMAGTFLLVRVPNSEAHHLWMVHRYGDGLLIVVGIYFLCDLVDWDEGASVWWLIAPHLMLIVTGAVALAGADWLLFRRFVGVEVIALGLAIMALGAAEPQERPQGLLTSLLPASGLSYVVAGLAVVSVPGPLPPPLPGDALPLQNGLMFVLCGVATLRAPATGRLEERPLLRALVASIFLAGGAARLLWRTESKWPSFLGLLATVTLHWVARREAEGSTEAVDEEG